MYKKKKEDKLLALKVNFTDSDDVKLTAHSLQADHLWEGDCFWLHVYCSAFKNAALRVS